MFRHYSIHFITGSNRKKKCQKKTLVNLAHRLPFDNPSWKYIILIVEHLVCFDCVYQYKLPEAS